MRNQTKNNPSYHLLFMSNIETQVTIWCAMICINPLHLRCARPAAIALALCPEERGSKVFATRFQGFLPNVASPPLPPEAFFPSNLTIESIPHAT